MHFKALAVTLLGLSLFNSAMAFDLEDDLALKFNPSLEVAPPKLNDVLDDIRYSAVVAGHGFKANLRKEIRIDQEFAIQRHHAKNNGELIEKAHEDRIEAVTKTQDEKYKMELLEAARSQAYAVHIAMNAIKQALLDMRKEGLISNIEIKLSEVSMKCLQGRFEGYSSKYLPFYSSVNKYRSAGVEDTLPCTSQNILVKFDDNKKKQTIYRPMRVLSQLRELKEVEKLVQETSVFNISSRSIYGLNSNELKEAVLEPYVSINYSPVERINKYGLVIVQSSR